MDNNYHNIIITVQNFGTHTRARAHVSLCSVYRVGANTSNKYDCEVQRYNNITICSTRCRQKHGGFNFLLLSRFTTSHGNTIWSNLMPYDNGIYTFIYYCTVLILCTLCVQACHLSSEQINFENLCDIQTCNLVVVHLIFVYY